ncbi:hypothetical protein D3C86_1937350 [compost metagenome]
MTTAQRLLFRRTIWLDFCGLLSSTIGAAKTWPMSAASPAAASPAAAVLSMTTRLAALLAEKLLAMAAVPVAVAMLPGLVMSSTK